MVLSTKIDRNNFRGIFGTGYSIEILLYVGAVKKDMQQKILHRTDIHIKTNRNFWWNSVPDDHSNAYLPDISNIRAS